ncbi:MAG: hypothetical protein U0359_22685 [Byssovorax sp.]
MPISRVAFVGLFTLTAGLGAACGGVTEATGASGTTSGSTTTTTTGAGGEGGAASTTATTTTTTTGAGGMGGSGPDIGEPSDMYPAPHGPPPTVVSFGGPVLHAPVFVPVFFQNDDADIKTKLKDFDAKIGATEYWKATTSEYGVGAGTATAPLELMEDAPNLLSDGDIQTWLTGKLNADDMTFGPAPADVIYVLHYPSTTTITDGSGAGSAKSCVDFGGYHSNVALDANHGGKNVAYAVIPRCSNFGGLTGVDAVTGPISHELVEAATDPYPMVNPAYAQIDNNHIFWMRLIGGGETGDMCAQFDSSFTTFPELPDYVVQRSWSNKAAKAGHDPCQPAPAGEVYFNSVPVLKDTVKANIFGQTVNVKGVTIPVGSTKVVDIQLFSDGDTGGPWDVQVDDLATLFGGQPHLDISLDASSGQNGQTLHATITVNSAGKSNTESFLVRSKLNGRQTVWLGIVGN